MKPVPVRDVANVQTTRPELQACVRCFTETAVVKQCNAIIFADVVAARPELQARVCRFVRAAVVKRYNVRVFAISVATGPGQHAWVTDAVLLRRRS